jgi:tripartite-type tricarboxylate transporter receptor subunit TctC
MTQLQKRKTLGRLAAIAGAALTGLGTTKLAFAQAFPDRPLTILGPFNTGGFNDRMARAFAPFLQKQLGQPLTVVNRGGAGALLGHTYFLQQPADGYMIAMTSVNFIPTNIGLQDAKFKLSDFDCLNLPSNDFSMLATSKDSAWKSVDQVLDALKKDPKSVSIGVQPGSADLINITLLLRAAGIDPTQVRLVTFKGGGPARNAVLGGTVDVGLVGAEGFLPLRSRVVPLMLFNDERLPAWADVQTVTEYAAAKNLNVEWVPGSQRGWVLPAGVGKQNPAIRARWVDAIQKAMNDPQWIAMAKELQLPNPWYGPEKSQQSFIKGSETVSKHMDLLKKS